MTCIRPAGRRGACSCGNQYAQILDRLDTVEQEASDAKTTAQTAANTASIQAANAAADAAQAASDAGNALTQAGNAAASAAAAALDAGNAAADLASINSTISSTLSTYLGTKVDKLSTTGSFAYTHTNATQGETALVDGTTSNTIPIRDGNGRMQAADPASGATDKTLVTANWVSQTGDSGPNNLVHRSGNETKNGIFTIDRIITRSLYFNARTGGTTNTWRHIATISGTTNGRVWGILHFNQSQRFGFFELQLGSSPKFFLFIKKSINVNNVAINYDGNGNYYIMIRTPYSYQTGAMMPFIIQKDDVINTSIYQEVIGGTIYNDASEFPLANTVYGQFEGVDAS